MILNDIDSSMSVKTFTSMVTANIQIRVAVATELKKQPQTVVSTAQFHYFCLTIIQIITEVL